MVKGRPFKHRQRRCSAAMTACANWNCLPKKQHRKKRHEGAAPLSPKGSRPGRLLRLGRSCPQIEPSADPSAKPNADEKRPDAVAIQNKKAGLQNPAFTVLWCRRGEALLKRGPQHPIPQQCQGYFPESGEPPASAKACFVPTSRTRSKALVKWRGSNSGSTSRPSFLLLPCV